MRDNEPTRDITSQAEPDRDDSIEGVFDQVQRAAGVNLEQMAARVHARLFTGPVDPVRIGRFVILERVGQGGMGVVYQAYDPKLDRRVALKLIRSRMGIISSWARDRFMREARALARLSHPNIVPIHDVGTIDDQVFIVMGFVEGQTVREWVDAERPGWRAIVDSYLQAARGLQAAHRVALIHRDFKPDNALVSRDGRIQVVDFGLARVREPAGSNDESSDDSNDGSSDSSNNDSGAHPDHGSNDETDARPTSTRTDRRMERVEDTRGSQFVSPQTRPAIDSLTATGMLVGTPAYMSPEQYASGPVGPASDQFSFCVALYESLYGRRPFSGASEAHLRVAVSSGAIQAPPRSIAVPGWLEPIIRRGLQPEPSARYKSMGELIAALSRDPTRTRRRRLMAAIVPILLALLAYFAVAKRSETAPVCQGAYAALSPTWNPTRRTALTHALAATGQTYAPVASPRIIGQVDAYADAWTGAHRQTCLAHRRGEQSGTLLDLRMACLEKRRVALAAALDVIEDTEATTLDRALELIAALPRIGYCADAEALSAEIPPPEDPEAARRVRQLSDLFAQVQALERAGRYARALELLSPLLARAESVGYRPLMAELALVQGRLTIAHGTREHALASLRRAANLGLASGRFDVGLEALARRIYVEGTWAEHRGDPLATLDLARSLMPHHPDPAFAHALLLNNAGVVHMARSERAQARAFFQEAAAVRTTSDHEYMELATVDFNLGMVTERAEERIALMNRAADSHERVLGAEHPRTLEYRRVAAAYRLDPQVVVQTLAPTCAALARYHPDLRGERARCEEQLGLVAAELGDTRMAAATLRDAGALFERANRQVRAHLAIGRSALHAGDYDRALAALTESRSRLPAEPDRWWERKLVAEYGLTQASVALARGQYARAQATLEPTLAAFLSVTAHSHKAQVSWHVAEARTALATALWGSDLKARPDAPERVRAMRLIDCAEDWYRATGPGFANRLADIAEWRASRGLAGELADRLADANRDSTDPCEAPGRLEP